MIEFKELRVSPDGRSLIIDVKISNDPIYEDIFIDTIFIDTDETYIDNGPSSKSIYQKSFNLEKRVQLKLDKELAVSLNDTMFFVWVVAKGDVKDSCDRHKFVKLGVTVNLYPVYQKLMYGIKGISEDCSYKKNKFIDDTLRFKAVELAVKTGNYTEAIKYWNRFFKNKNSCKCNG